MIILLGVGSLQVVTCYHVLTYSLQIARFFPFNRFAKVNLCVFCNTVHGQQIQQICNNHLVRLA